MSRAILTIVAFCLGIASTLAYLDHMNNKTYECTFDRIQGKYTTTRLQLNSDGVFIIVQSTHEREHAFRRSQLQTCQETTT